MKILYVETQLSDFLLVCTLQALQGRREMQMGAGGALLSFAL
jgi:hypothetical protein